MKRREFIQLTAAGLMATQGTTTTWGREPIERTGPPRFQLGLAAYSFRDYFGFMKGKPQKAAPGGPALDMIGFLDYCVAQKIDAAELTSYFFRPDPDDQYFLDIKREAFIRGVTISGTAIGNNFTVGRGPKLDREVEDAIRWIDRAAILGAPHIRFFAGTAAQLASHPDRIVEASEALARCAEYAATKGIFLGVENHGNLTGQQMLELMERTNSPWVGINLDTGNFLSDDPYGDLEKCVPFAVNVQVKVAMRTPDNQPYPADLDRIAKILEHAGYQGFVILEFEEENPYERIPNIIEKFRTVFA
ncbi:Xylose isomerase-like TIM barrel [Rubripirellula tenax]|uniref:Xylose isomerase-like TIM barrel n=1 Tax=Rubripirellula tenax TaxID=2528015 RepID=A0A5C6EES3_9BACT|nr:sugar phosphate isomerase/epimerase family protein [Rubripirellula tenax]TWU47328.1 Xylose isomerase-like TIM barrel [Rubripirellula tenax]